MINLVYKLFLPLLLICTLSLSSCVAYTANETFEKTITFKSFQEIESRYFLTKVTSTFLTFQNIDDLIIKQNSLGEPDFNIHKLLPKNRSIAAIRSIKEVKFCGRINQKLGNIEVNDCLVLKLNPASLQTVNGRNIFHTKIQSLDKNNAHGRVMLIGGVHGNEISSVELVINWMKHLKQDGSRKYDWRIIPLMNPDGFFKDNSTRTNANGVDLNRNLPTLQWEQLAIKNWRQKTKSAVQKYPGPKAVSEPETKWLIDEIDTFKPNVIISVHAPFDLVDYDARNLSKAPKKLGMLASKELPTFPGSLGRYAVESRNIPVITIELPDSFQSPNPKQMKQIWLDLLAWLDQNIKSIQSQKMSTT